MRRSLLLVWAWTCQGLYDEVHHIASARLYGNVHDYAYYFLDLSIGTPPQRVSVIVDTGSSITGFPCKSCEHCGQHIDPLFEITRSRTASWVKCNTKNCHGFCSSDQKHCTYRQSFTEGSSFHGWWFQDLVRLGDLMQHNPPLKALVGCHQEETRLFYTQKANGIMGIRYPKSGPPTLLQQLLRDREHINEDK
ncbi:Aspartic proteinase CDR1 [Symbiodinium microadriaticum]|uniref:Aspartic proteinase CDR1 n=1 Tax=Symbiodinium microadriaticum TaxID=2951 RepID=A0A1Q9C8X9_SYMMI|nr:Aspartic proteinase CDR1 [Symbiodinium microadriaticum]